MKIAIIAPPWLSTYPGCYYGIENVIHNLTTTLKNKGHEVVLFSVRGTTTSASKRYWYHQDDQYQHIHRPWYETVPVISSHLLYSLNIIRKAGDYDIIHDHNSFMGPAMMAFLGKDFPSVLHTLHEPFTDEKLIKKGIPDNRMLFEELRLSNIFFNGISKSQLKTAPPKLKKSIIGRIPNGVDVGDYVFESKKSDYFLSVGRISPDKGQATAAKLCDQLGVKLKIAGTIGSGITTRQQLAKELATPSNGSLNSPDFKYYKDKIEPHIKPGQIEYLGTIFGQPKIKLFSKAKAFLSPINWEEPFGIALIDALACGTPVVAYRRGAFEEIIKHGQNGFLANSEKEFKEYITRVDEIDPYKCRKSVEEHFSAEAMTDKYIDLYKKIISYKNRKRVKLTTSPRVTEKFS